MLFRDLKAKEAGDHKRSQGIHANEAGSHIAKLLLLILYVLAMMMEGSAISGLVGLRPPFVELVGHSDNGTS